MAVITKTIGATGRDYSTITAWEADLDNTSIYASADQAVGECYDDAVFDEHVALNGGGTVGLSKRTLTVAAGHRHDGTAGTGARIVASAASRYLGMAIRPSVIEWLELDVNHQNSTYGLACSWAAAGTGDGLFLRCIVHGVWMDGNVHGMYENATGARFSRCIAYDIRMVSGSSATASGLTGGSSSRVLAAVQCTIYGVHVATGTGSANCYRVNLTNKTCTSCIGGGATSDGTGAAAAFSTGSLITYALSDDASASGTGSIASGTLGFVSTTTGSEDLHITSSSSAINSALVPASILYQQDVDINGYNCTRRKWDIGAHEYVAPPVIKSIGATGRDYSTIEAWEADLDSSSIYIADDEAIGECYDDADFDATPAITINGGGTIDLFNVTLRAASTARHDGTPGSGARLVGYGAQSTLLSPSNPNSIYLTIDGLELDGNGYAINVPLDPGGGSSQPLWVYRCLSYGQSGAFGSQSGFYDGGSTRLITIADCFGFRCNNVTNSAVSAVGIYQAKFCYNNTIHGINRDLGSGRAAGIESYDVAGFEVKNCLVGDITGNTTGDISCFYLTSNNVTSLNNLSSDGTATGTGSLTNKAASNQFISTTWGSEDLHLKTGADAIDAGVNIGTTPVSVEYDINWRNRVAGGDTWDIGAHEYVSAGGPQTFYETPAASITPASIVIFVTSKPLSADLTSSGTYTHASIKAQILDAALTSSAAVVRFVSAVKTAVLTSESTMGLAHSCYRTLTGALTTARTLVRSTAKPLLATITPAAALAFVKSQTRTLTAELTSLGALNKLAALVKTAASTSSGAITSTLSSVRTFTANITPSGVATRAASYARTFAGTLTSAALTSTAVVKLKLLTSALTSSAARIRQTSTMLARTLTPSGVGARVSTYARGIAGTLTTTSVLSRATALVKSATLTSSSVITRAMTAVRTGTLSIVGTLRNAPARLYGATLASGGALLRDVRTSLVGTASATGAVLKHTSTTLIGALTSSASVLAERIAAAVQRTLTGAVTLAGGLLRQVSAIRSGTLTPAGEPRKSSTAMLLGVLAPHALASKAASLVKTGVFASSSTISTLGVKIRALTSALTSTGSTVKQTLKSHIASLTHLGSVVRSSQRTTTGSIAPAASHQRLTRLERAGQLATSSTLGLFRLVLRAVSGGMTMMGSVRRTFGKLTTAAVATTTRRVRGVTKVLARELTPTGLARQFRELVLTRAFGFLSWLTTLVRRAEQRPLTIDVRASTSDVVLDAALSHIECRANTVKIVADASVTSNIERRARRSFFSLRAHNRRR